jgi:hypothetical protein
MGEDDDGAPPPGGFVTAMTSWAASPIRTHKLLDHDEFLDHEPARRWPRARR